MSRLLFASCILAMVASAVSGSAAEITGRLVDERGNVVANRLLHFYHGDKSELLSARTDAEGGFSTGEALSEDVGLVLAEETDGWPLSRVVFLAKDIELQEGEKREMNFVLAPQKPTDDNEEALRLLGCDWPVQLVRRRVVLPEAQKKPDYPKQLHGAAVQVGDVEHDEEGRVTAYSIYARLGVNVEDGKLTWLTEAPQPPLSARETRQGLEVANDRLALVLPTGKDPMAPPILRVRGVDGQWFGRGSWDDVDWDSCKVESLDSGPVFVRYRITYAKADGESYAVTVTLGTGDDYFRIDEETRPGLTGQWSLDLSEGFAPDHHRQYRHYAAYAPAAIPSEPTVLGSIQPWTFVGIMEFRETVSIHQQEGRRDAFAVCSVDGSEWITPEGEHFYDYAEFSSRNGWKMPADTTAVRLLAGKGGKVRLEYPLQAGVRITGWSVYDKEYDVTRHKALDFRHILSDTPLSDVLEMKLAWDAPVVGPRLPGSVKQLRKRGQSGAYDSGAYFGYLSGRRDLIPQLRREVMNWCAGEVNYFRWQDPFEPNRPPGQIMGYVGLGQRAIEVAPRARYASDLADFAFAMGALSSEEMGYVRAALAFTAYKHADPELYASMNALGNFKVDGYLGLMVLAMLLKEHPDHDLFWHHYMRQLQQDVDEGVYLFKDGGTNECPIYVSMAMNFLTAQAWYLRQHGMDYDLASKERFKAALEFMGEWLTPPIPGVHDNSARVHPLIGDTTTGSSYQFGFFGNAAKIYEKTDPEFAGKMLWYWNLLGKPVFGGHGGYFTSAPNFMCFDVEQGKPPVSRSSVKPVNPGPYPSRAVDGFGLVLHKDWNAPDEFMFLMKAGRSSGHDHPDDGGFILFAWGKCISTGYGKSPYMTDSWRYNLVRFDGRSNWSRGKVTGFLGSELCDAATAHIPVVNVSNNKERSLREQWEAIKAFTDSTWEDVHDTEPSWYDRTLIFNRPDQYLVIYDVTGPRYKTDWFAHVMSDDYTVDGSTVSLPGREGVGVDIHILKPAQAKPAIIPVFNNLFANELAAEGGRKPSFPGGPDQTVIQLHQPPQSEYLAVWHPRKAGVTAPLKVKRGRVMKIESPSGTSLFVCERETGEFREGDFALNGSVGYLIRSGKQQCLGLLKGTEVRLGDYVFAGSEGVQLQAVFADGKLAALQVAAPSEVKVSISAPVDLHVRSKEAGISASGREITLEIPPGQATLQCK